MAKNIKSAFEEFHDIIRITNLDKEEENNKILREKRDLLLEDIGKHIKKLNEDRSSKDQITYETFNQGSYAMNTGVIPLDGDDYDIDTAIVFNINIEDYPDPTTVKQWVHDALTKKNNRTVDWKTPCITVQYTKAGEDMYHVDFAVYAYDEDSDKYYLARGKKNSLEENKYWDESSPKELKDAINNKFEDREDRYQFKRAIKYLKRWKDEKFSSETGNGKPTGIALTALCYDHFSPKTVDTFTGDKDVDDLQALLDVVNEILNSAIWSDIEIYLPVPPSNNLFEDMTSTQMDKFKTKLITLKDKLNDANNSVDPHEASKLIEKVLGSDFPIIEKEKTARAFTAPAMVNSGESA